MRKVRTANYAPPDLDEVLDLIGGTTTETIEATLLRRYGDLAAARTRYRAMQMHGEFGDLRPLAAEILEKED